MERLKCRAYVLLEQHIHDLLNLFLRLLERMLSLLKSVHMLQPHAHDWLNSISTRYRLTSPWVFQQRRAKARVIEELRSLLYRVFISHRLDRGRRTYPAPILLTRLTKTKRLKECLTSLSLLVKHVHSPPKVGSV